VCVLEITKTYHKRRIVPQLENEMIFGFAYLSIRIYSYHMVGADLVDENTFRS
jgi:hypothetical protein